MFTVIYTNFLLVLIDIRGSIIVVIIIQIKRILKYIMCVMLYVFVYDLGVYIHVVTYTVCVCVCVLSKVIA